MRREATRPRRSPAARRSPLRWPRRRGPRWRVNLTGKLFLANEPLRSAAVLAPEGYKVGREFPNFAGRDRHRFGASQTGRIIAGIGRVEQKLLVGHGDLRSALLTYRRRR